MLARKLSLILSTLAGGCLITTPTAHADIGLVMGETGISLPTAQDVIAAQRLYLEPNGFTGTAIGLDTPESYANTSYLVGEQDLISTLETDYHDGLISAADPAYVFGYSQSALISGLAEPTLSAYGIPEADLHFELVGDDGSAYGGMANAFPWLFDALGYTSVAGATTPDQYYPTDVYTIPDDNWADSVNASFFGIPSLSSEQHLEYLGVSSQDIANASLAHVDGLTDYYTVEPAYPFMALIDALLESWNIAS